MKTDEFKVLNPSRRIFLAGTVTGASILAVPVFLNNTSLINTKTIQKDIDFGFQRPKLRYYPVVHEYELHRVYKWIIQAIMPGLATLKDYKRNEYKIFKSILDKSFFFLANEYVQRIQNYFQDKNILIPVDRGTGIKLLSQSTLKYPEAWSEIIHGVIMFDSSITKAFSLQDN